MTKTPTLETAFARFVNAQVQSGALASRRNILNAVRRLVQHELASADGDIQHLRDALQPGIDSGSGRDAAEVFDDLERRYMTMGTGGTA